MRADQRRSATNEQFEIRASPRFSHLLVTRIAFIGEVQLISFLSLSLSFALHTKNSILTSTNAMPLCSTYSCNGMEEIILKGCFHSPQNDDHPAATLISKGQDLRVSFPKEFHFARCKIRHPYRSLESNRSPHCMDKVQVV